MVAYGELADALLGHGMRPFAGPYGGGLKSGSADAADAGGAPRRPRSTAATGTRMITSTISASLTKEERRAGRRVTAEKSRELDETRREMSEARKRDAARAGRGAPW